ncbi:RNA polymerase III subunit C53 [Tachypleus tridentatus]|uniref:RNA polymerase III subunit C53 n=1 Tax=Tachypleus tridentatus TaxID=6853 RepID=UPI003FD37B7F
MNPNQKTSNESSNSGAGSSSSSDITSLPKGLLGRAGVPLGRGARLPSIRGPRDLTLGGIPKRVFTPNIPTRRDRSKDADQKTQSSRPSPRGGRRERGGDRGRGVRGRGRGELIQTEGLVFGEGPSDQMTKRGSYGSRSYSSADKEPSFLAKPKFTPTPNRTKQEKEEDEATLKELLKDDFIDDPNERGEKIQPVQLPLYNSVKQEIKSENKNDVFLGKQRIRIKQEPVDDDDNVEMKIDIKDLKPNVQGEEQITAKDLFTNIHESELLFFQFPTVLPGFVDSPDEEVKPNIKTDNMESNKHTSPIKTEKGEGDRLPSKFGCSLADLPEGYVGKLQVFKSGKTRLRLGPVVMNVEIGTPVGFLQNLVSLRLFKDTGDMTVLGHVQHKLVLSPDIENLLSMCKR